MFDDPPTPPPDPLSLHDAIVEATHLIDMAVSAALGVAGSDHFLWQLRAIAVEAEQLRSGMPWSDGDARSAWSHDNGEFRG
ncbi:hypothetical protein GGR88_001547 [Sphingomonas jejuensis]|uniref:Uncharacterized protein n=1 Tax=Sphingomonas jejuensis TaxID=904715 RepID=A0ABX0XLN2_9SPHN|nr:hypothetical protein [Sphingomonas jejuensis]NJC34073.1 hypothetical protein [Sphingomonas jejuensis]